MGDSYTFQTTEPHTVLQGLLKSLYLYVKDAFSSYQCTPVHPTGKPAHTLFLCKHTWSSTTMKSCLAELNQQSIFATSVSEAKNPSQQTLH